MQCLRHNSGTEEWPLKKKSMLVADGLEKDSYPLMMKLSMNTIPAFYWRLGQSFRMKGWKKPKLEVKLFFCSGLWCGAWVTCDVSNNVIMLKYNIAHMSAKQASHLFYRFLSVCLVGLIFSSSIFILLLKWSPILRQCLIRVRFHSRFFVFYILRARDQ